MLSVSEKLEYHDNEAVCMRNDAETHPAINGNNLVKNILV